jgi:predicted SAM-dependent methyltransferase
MSANSRLLLLSYITQTWENLYRISDDVHVLAARYQEPITEELAGKMLALVDTATAIAGECAALRQTYVEGLKKNLAIDPTARGLKVHLGAGTYRLPSWINVDTCSDELPLNIKWGLPFPSGSSRFVFFSHTLEHLAYPEEVNGVLAEIHRVLEPGGVVRIIVPDTEKSMKAYAFNNAEHFAAREKTWTWWSGNQTKLESLLAYVGVSRDTSPIMDRHKFGYDYETLNKALCKANFKRIEKSTFMGSAYPELRVDDQSLVASAKYGDEFYSLFVEAMKL